MMNFINFDLLDTLLGLLLCALFVLGTLFIATEVRASPEAGPTLADSVLAVPAIATAAQEKAPV
ncbi:MAG: hypothetical protein CL950_04490 [Erythrobacter sp.]|nr:hypothetical protein [Erythrobacter sp.]|tara:strand:- start:170 stop:361 length:192 start_codon:yes stop_codon:yes gene_type:complete